MPAICVDCGEVIEDFSEEVRYFVCFECLADNVE